MSKLRFERATVLLACGVVAAGVGIVSLAGMDAQLDALAACEATERGAWDETLTRSEALSLEDETGRAAAECRCLALLASGREAECAQLLEEALSTPGAENWAPNPQLSVHLIQTWREQGRLRDAANLALRAGALHPQHPELFYVELVTRGSVEDEPALLQELALRLPTRGPAAARMRAMLAGRYLLRAEPALALEVLGASAPPQAGAAADRWFETRALAFALNADLAGVRQSFAEWERAGLSAERSLAHYALTLSLAGLADPERSPEVLLRAALEQREALDPELEEKLSIRLILTLVNAGRQEQALALYDATRSRFEFAGLRREELERSAAHRALAADPAARRRGVLRFRLPPGPGELLLSPEALGGYGHAEERVEIERTLGTAPQRWVYRDSAGHTRASGTVSPIAGATLEIDVQAGPAHATERVTLSRLPGDGRRRVMLLLLDCGDWRLTQYLRTRGELPVLDALLASGYRAVLESRPALTAAALEALVWPRHHAAPSFVGLVHQFGTELAGLADVGENPLDALTWIMPEREDLFSVIGRGPRSAANLLFAHGGRRAGRHSEITGPDGRRRRSPLPTSTRDLDARERERFPALARVNEERDAIHLRTIAAELDTAREIAAAGEIDLLMLRIEPLDILTHAHFAETVRDGQDDGRGLLYSVYRYIDARLGEIAAALDEDDILVVMSDHGIRTAMEHSNEAFFVAVGAGVPIGRAVGQPSLRGIPAVLAALLGVQANWPDSGIAPWATAVATR